MADFRFSILYFSTIVCHIQMRPRICIRRPTKLQLIVTFFASLLVLGGFSVVYVRSLVRTAAGDWLALLDLDGKYVALDTDSVCDGRRLGNQMFTISALLYVAHLTNRVPVLPSRASWNCLDDYEQFFDATSSDNIASNVTAVKYISDRFDLCPCFRFEERLPMAYDESIVSMVDHRDAASNRMLLLAGYYQSWRYVDPVADAVRRALTFTPEIQEAAAFYLVDALPLASSVSKQLVRVGIHARRGDMASVPKLVKNGYEPPGIGFYRQAIDYFVERYDWLQFIVCSDNIKWARKNIIIPKKIASSAKGNAAVCLTRFNS